MSDVITKGFKAQPSDLEKINQFARRNLSLDEVYTFSIILCDNEIDRDYERFTVQTLHQLSKLFIGKTGIFDHNPKGQNQTARIFETEVLADDNKRTSTDEPYTCIKSKAYMVKTEKNKDLMLEIDAGIKKEVSVSCSVQKISCSICNKDMRTDSCNHHKSKQYDENICHHLLKNATDAYEWSFVAVPAQKNAGITKSFTKGKEDIMQDTQSLLKSFSECKDNVTISKQQANDLVYFVETLKQTSSLGKQYKEDLISEVKRLSFLTNESIPADVMSTVLEKMDIIELKAFKKAYSQKLESDSLSIQLAPTKNSESNSSTNQFKL